MTTNRWLLLLFQSQMIGFALELFLLAFWLSAILVLLRSFCLCSFSWTEAGDIGAVVFFVYQKKKNSIILHQPPTFFSKKKKWLELTLTRTQYRTIRPTNSFGALFFYCTRAESLAQVLASMTVKIGEGAKIGEIPSSYSMVFL